MLLTHHITECIRYVDDIFIIFNKIKKHIKKMVTEFNEIHPYRAVTTANASNNRLNFFKLKNTPQTKFYNSQEPYIIRHLVHVTHMNMN